MPLYEYRCNSCGDVFDVIQKFVDEPLTTHENCGGAVERLISTSALQFKGTGWYITDYARGGNGGADKAKTEKSADSADSKKTETTKSEPAKTSTDTAASSAKTSSDK